MDKKTKKYIKDTLEDELHDMYKIYKTYKGIDREGYKIQARAFISFSLTLDAITSEEYHNYLNSINNWA